MLQALHALLRFLAAAELSARLQQLLPAGAATPGRRQELEEQWRIKCAELLAAVMAELAGLKVRGLGRCRLTGCACRQAGENVRRLYAGCKRREKGEASLASPALSSLPCSVSGPTHTCRMRA